MARAKKQPEFMPAAVVLSAPHGYVDDSGVHQYWHAGQVVEDPEMVALLIERRAPLENFNYEE